MTIAIDADDMDAVRRGLGRAAEGVGGVVPTAPSAAAFGPAVLGGAVATFDDVVRREAQQLARRWRGLDADVRAAFDDLSGVDADASTALTRLREVLG